MAKLTGGVILAAFLMFALSCTNPMLQVIEEDVKHYEGRYPLITEFVLQSSAVTNNGTIAFSLIGENISSWLISQNADIPAANDPGWIEGDVGSYELVGGDGQYTLYAWGKDADGSISESATFSVTLDTVLPVINTFSLAGSDPTGSVDISLTLDNSDDIAVYGWYLSETSTTPGLADNGWVFSVPSTFQLSTGDGAKTVYLWIRDEAGNISTPSSMSLTLDQGVPTINNLVAPTHSNAALINISVDTSDGDLVGWMIKEDDNTAPAAGDAGWLSVAPTTFTLTDVEGPYTMYAWVKDDAGNVSGTASRSVVLDKTAPSGSLALAGGQDNVTSSSTISVDITESDNVGVSGWYLSESSSTPAAGAAGWVAVEPTTFDVTGLEGEKTIYCWVKDQAANVTAGGSVSLYYYTTQPTVSLTNNELLMTGHEDIELVFSEAIDTTSVVVTGGFFVTDTDFSKNWVSNTLTLALQGGNHWVAGTNSFGIAGTVVRAGVYDVPVDTSALPANLTVFHGVYVKAGEVGTEGTSADPFGTIQEGIDNADTEYTNATVKISVGSYTTTGTTAVLANGISLSGGYETDWSTQYTSWATRDLGSAYQTIITNDNTTGSVSDTSPAHTILCDSSVDGTSLIEYITVGVPHDASGYNAGLLVQGSPFINGLLVKGRTTAFGQTVSGITITGSSTSPSIDDSRIYPEYASSESYGLYVSDSAFTITGSHIDGASDGGLLSNAMFRYAIALLNSGASSFTAIINTCTIDNGNSNGGALNSACLYLVSDSNPYIEDNTLYASNGYAIYEEASATGPTSLTHNDFYYTSGTWYRESDSTEANSSNWDSTPVSILSSTKTLCDAAPTGFENYSTGAGITP